MTTTITATKPQRTSKVTDEQGEHHEATEAAGAEHYEATETSSQHEDSDEEVFGMKRESVPFIVAGVVISLALAGLVWIRLDRRLLWTVAGFAVLFAALDAAEFFHQLDERRTAIAVIAAVVALLHAAAALVAETCATNQPAPS